MERVVDFTSALYLDFQHASRSLPAWERLTEGRPVALQERALDTRVAHAIAELQGTEAGVLGTSTLHLSWDLGGMLARSPFLVDSGTYAVGCWSAERARARGSLVRTFRHHDPEALQDALVGLPRGARPVVLCDGFCPGCGRAAPLPAFLDRTRASGALVIVDDTQSLGVYGHSPSERNLYGLDGGGSLRWWGLPGGRVLLIASLAKAFGAPLAALSGSNALIAAFRSLSSTREQCSPPSAANVCAAWSALQLNRRNGNRVRESLLERVMWFRAALEQAGIRTRGGTFPVLTLSGIEDSRNVHAALMAQGVRTVLHRSPAASSAHVSFIVTTRHSWPELLYALECTARVLETPASRHSLTRHRLSRKEDKPCGRLATGSA